MNRQQAETILTTHLHAIFGFALKRCKNIHDAEDLSQEIALRTFRALLVREDIEDPEKFLWTVAHNALANYYRDSARYAVNLPIDALAELLADSNAEEFDPDAKETIDRLQREIAYLSKLQRQIVIAYYFENRKQAEIAQRMGIPLGTVKWHLFEAKKELKRGMETMRRASELKFNPIRFYQLGMSGNIGENGGMEIFFRSALSQNIAYLTWKEPKTVNEMADALGVSPVYVEDEAEHLAKYGFLLKRGQGYLCNILLEETTKELLQMRDELFEESAKLLANDLYDALLTSGLLDDADLWGGITGQITMTATPPKDRNFLLWALIPYILCFCNEKTRKKLTFQEVATIRPDGGQNTAHASILGQGVTVEQAAKDWNGPCWNYDHTWSIWQFDSAWSAQRITDTHAVTSTQELKLLKELCSDATLSAESYALLASQGYIVTCGEPDGTFKTAMRCVYIRGRTLKEKLIEIGEKVRAEHSAELIKMQESFANAVLVSTPDHLRKMQEYCLQETFYTNGYFLQRCLQELVENGRLIPPPEEQKQSLSIVLTRE